MCSSETSVDLKGTTRCYIPEDRTLCNHRCENVRSCADNLVDPTSKFDHAISVYRAEGGLITTVPLVINSVENWIEFKNQATAAVCSTTVVLVPRVLAV
jgi:hypothetical protein